MSRNEKQAAEMAALLLDLEATLRQLNLWQSESPCAEALASTQPFCIDTLEFSQWLQFIFIARIQFMLAQQAPLPVVSGITAMAEEVYRQQAEVSSVLLPVLRAIDGCLGQGVEQARH
ncbi:YqcC family protein [Pseudoteredinibacter isoporae]|uniref:YqcC family protein n=1 Tax=Pseudoteredinibacter isoporae TaxID=570281 RepID=UPI00310C1237